MKKIKVGARASPLSQAQVKEVLHEIRNIYPDIEFEAVYLETTGDKDRMTSLRALDKTDFFTKEVDQLLLNGKCRIAIHSAKDLPEPIPPGLAIAAITRGVDAADVVVLKPGVFFENLPSGALIATSSERREEQVKQLRQDLKFCDLRGTIAERLELLDKNVDGVVVAEAALIRLGLTHLNRIRLPGKAAPYQGQLAILCRQDDGEILNLFAGLDCRRNKNILYLGLELPESTPADSTFIHHPIIKIQTCSSDQHDIINGFKDILSYSHFLFTSKSTVHAFFTQFSFFGYQLPQILSKKMICVGKQTAKVLQSYGIQQPLISPVETAEGMVDFLMSQLSEESYFFWPHAALSRPVIRDFLIAHGLKYKECVLYETFVNKDLVKIHLHDIDEIHFTSPSTVDAFIQIYGPLPKEKILKAIGPITEQKLLECL